MNRVHHTVRFPSSPLVALSHIMEGMRKPLPTPLAERIYEVLHETGHSQADLARATGLSKQAITNIMSGSTKTLKSVSAAAISKRTGYSMRWLATGQLPKKDGANSLTKEDADPMFRLEVRPDDLRLLEIYQALPTHLKNQLVGYGRALLDTLGESGNVVPLVGRSEKIPD